jgi:hypothetical protein
VLASASSANANEEKYDCYFAYSKQLAHRYILTINRKIIIVTIIMNYDHLIINILLCFDDVMMNSNDEDNSNNDNE